MREILFRGKHKGDGGWVYGVPIQCHDGDWQICTDAYKYTVNPQTIGQYTGLDANGTKIFEGDVVKYVFPVGYAKPDIGVVKFSECDINLDKYFECGFFIEWEDSYLRKDIGYWTNYEKNKIEVIGNIHDNPEILKGE